jgi:hypothetical protein
LCSAAIVTNKLKSYEAAEKQVMPSVEHRAHKGLNNQAENSHPPTRVRERRMRRFKSLGQTQRFLSAFGPIRDHFHPKQHQLAFSPLLDRFETISTRNNINWLSLRFWTNSRPFPPETTSIGFLSAFGPIQDHFHLKQHQLAAKRYREQLCQRFQDWREVAGLDLAA